MTAPAIGRRSDYVAAVALELQDLDASDRDELIEELDDHIAALLVDRPDADLVTELGSPREYAFELRTAAGLAGTDRAPQSVVPQLKAWAERVAEVGRTLTPRWLDRLLPDIRPAWWVLRAYLVAIIVAQLLRDGHGDTLTYLWPTYDTHRWPVVVVIAVLAVLSVRLGRWSPREAWVRILIVVANLVIIGAAVLMYRVQLGYGDDYGLDDSSASVSACTVTNLYPRDSNGRPLTGVSLYDQDGNPVSLSDLGCPLGGFATAFQIDSGVAVATSAAAPQNTYPLPVQSTVTMTPGAPEPTSASPSPQDTAAGGGFPTR